MTQASSDARERLTEINARQRLAKKAFYGVEDTNSSDTPNMAEVYMRENRSVRKSMIDSLRTGVTGNGTGLDASGSTRGRGPLLTTAGGQTSYSLPARNPSRPSTTHGTRGSSRSSLIGMTGSGPSIERRKRPASSSAAGASGCRASPSSSEGPETYRPLSAMHVAGAFPTQRKTINSFILPPKPNTVGQEEQRDYMNLLGDLADELNKTKHIVERKQAMVTELRDSNRVNLTLLSGIPEKLNEKEKLIEKRRNLEQEVAELEEKSQDASTYMLTLKLLEERNVITLSDIKRRIKELERDFDKFEGVCEKVTSQSLRVHNQTLEALGQYYSEEARLLRDRDYQESHCQSLRQELADIVNHEHEWEQHEQRLNYLAKNVRENMTSRAAQRRARHQKRQTTFKLFGKQMEAHEARKTIQQFEKVMRHIQESTGLNDSEQVFEYLTTFRGKTTTLQQIKEDAEVKIKKLQEERERLEGIRDGLVNRQVVGLDKLASHLDKPIQRAEVRQRENIGKFSKLQKLIAQVNTAFEAVSRSLSPMIPQATAQTILTLQPPSGGGGGSGSGSVTTSSILPIPESGGEGGDGERKLSVVDIDPASPSSKSERQSDAGSVSTTKTESVANMIAAERLLLFAIDMLNNPDDSTVKPTPRRRTTTLLSSMYIGKEDSALNVVQGSVEAEILSNASTPQQSSSPMSSEARTQKRDSSFTPSLRSSMNRRDRGRSMGGPSNLGPSGTPTSALMTSSSGVTAEILRGMDVTKVPISQNNIRVALHTDEIDDDEDDDDDDDGVSQARRDIKVSTDSSTKTASISSSHQNGRSVTSSGVHKRRPS